MGEEIKLSKKYLEPLRKLGVINELRLRDIHIKREFRRRVKKNPNKRKKEIKEELAEEFCMGLERIESILFDKSHSKKNNEPIVTDLK
jgi:hypothetical protein